MRNKILSALVASFLAVSAYAAPVSTTRATSNLMGLGMPAQLATEVVSLASGGVYQGQSFLPGVTNSYDLGSASLAWRNAYLGTNLIFTAASAKIIPGATSLLFRNTADSATTLSLLNNGTLTLGGALTTSSTILQVLGGSTNTRFDNSASSATNFTIADGGDVTIDRGNVIAATSTKGFIGGGVTAIPASILSDIGSTPFFSQVNPSSATAFNFNGIGNNASAPVISGYKTRAATGVATTVVQSGDGILSINGLGADGTNWKNAAKIVMTVDGTPGANDMPGAIDLQTSPDGSATTASVLKLDNAKKATFTGQLVSSATGSLGWTVVNAANQACNTTCTSACVIGIDTLGTGGFLDCATATADSCLCAGAS